jgi:hypothetical protein
MGLAATVLEVLGSVTGAMDVAAPNTAQARWAGDSRVPLAGRSDIPACRPTAMVGYNTQRPLADVPRRFRLDA